MTKDENIYYLYSDLESEMIMQIIDEWRENKGNPKARQNWKLIPAPLLIREWQYNAKTGFVHETAIEKIQEICIDNYLKLYINTILFGHEQISPYSYLETYIPEDWDEEYVNNWLEDFENFACDEYGTWRISDYATEKIGNLIIDLIAEEDYPKKLFWIDQILNVVHQRSDIARWFVEGGSTTLSALSN